MAPRGTPNATPRVQRTIVKTNTSKTVSATASAVKKTLANRKITEKTPAKGSNVTVERQRTNTVPKVMTPKRKETKAAIVPGSVTKSGKKLWKRRPKPAHSGVPVPEKMKKLELLLRDSDFNL